jgi:hypothetical protein
VGGNVKPGGLALLWRLSFQNHCQVPKSIEREREREGLGRPSDGQFTFRGGSQLFVSLRLHSKLDGETLPLDSVPYVTGSIPIVGLWEISKAVSSLIHSHKP